MIVRRDCRKAGFTLVELLIVVSIVGILASIGLPLYLDHRNRAYNASALSDLKNFRVGMEAYFSEHQSYPSW